VANILFSRELAKRYPEVTSVSLHPGVIVDTNLSHHMLGSGVMKSIVSALSKPFTKSIPQGAATTVFAAVSPLVKNKDHNGQYF